ncbi:MAG: hypothetical protein IJI80_06300 [Methanobrevibacter sp.]|uniref:hypothetical protein n=1 Tax=Methanobrevibacter sp. TaxID=66852 RepID=UPI0025FC3B47|nr:hypothetical protein [Methanobrevibacter sp.]MBQ6139271.1 hypothetical protein [Methanobrevibacter sp.]
MLNKIKQKINDLTITKRLKDEDDRKVLLKEIGCIDIGIIVGIVTYVICLYTHFDIYGWNFGLVLSPLFAGYAESLAAKRYLEESTGAISAFILFLITVVYGFIISNPTLGFNVITAGSIVIILQAAFPIAVNYFLIATVLGIISHVTGVFNKITRFIWNAYEKIFKREPKTKGIYIEKRNTKKSSFYDGELDMNKLGVLILTMEDSPKELNIIEYKGIYESSHIFSVKRRKEIKSGIEDSLENELLICAKIAEDKALLKLIKQLRADGCNGLLNLNMAIETLGPSKGENLSHVVMRGTGVIFEEKEDVSSL